MGVVTISLEIELGWGWHDIESYELLSPNRIVETRTLHWLLDLCDRLHIPITFDIVGHLLLDSCDGVHEGPHSTGWFKNDPGTNVDTNPQFYAPDLATAIKNRATPHETCTHTFSHIICDEVEPEVLAWELDMSRKIHSEFGFGKPRSFVPPRHAEPNEEILRKNGIRTLRCARPPPVESFTRKSQQRLRDWLFDRGHPCFALETNNGLVKTYTTPYPSLTAVHLQNGQQPPLAPFRAIPEKIRQRVHTKYLIDGIDRVANTESHIHYWSHLSNMANESQRQPIERFLTRLADARNRDMITIRPMQELAQSVNER